MEKKETNSCHNMQQMWLDWPKLKFDIDYFMIIIPLINN